MKLLSLQTEPLSFPQTINKLKNRNYIEEIQDIKSRRLKRGDRWEQLNRRFDPLIELSQNIVDIDNKNIKREMLRYVFICLIACIEGYFRLVIKDLIDNSEKCRKNIEKLSDIKFDISSVLAIHGKTISIGEFISHLVPLSSFESINKNMGLIMDTDFISELKEANFTNESGKDDKKMHSDTPEWVKKAFEMRNIYCHELAPKKEPTERLQEKAFICLLAIHEFTFISEIFIKDFLNNKRKIGVREE